MRVGYLGPEGTFTQEAMLASGLPEGGEPHPLPTVHDTVMAVHDGTVGRALVPIENSLEGSVNDTLDTLASDATDVRIVGEVVHPITQCLIAREGVAAQDVETVVSMPQASAQCARFLRAALPAAAIVPANSTADAVRTVAASDAPWAALGTALSAQLYGCAVLQEGVEDVAGNETRFVWLARAGEDDVLAGGGAPKTSVVFWGPGDDSPGWLVRCLSEFAFRGVNLTKIESRPRRGRLGHYLFHIDMDGRADETMVADAVRALHSHCEVVRLLGSYPAA